MTKPFPYVTRRIRVSTDDKALSSEDGKSLAVEEQEIRVLLMRADERAVEMSYCTLLCYALKRMPNKLYFNISHCVLTSGSMPNEHLLTHLIICLLLYKQACATMEDLMDGS